MLEIRARIAARLLGLAGAHEVPVLRGVGDPLPGGIAYRPTGSEGVGLLDHQPPPGSQDAPILDIPAADWLIETSHREHLQVVATGPLTTPAAAATRDPTLATRLGGITVMAGMFHPGSFPPYWRRAIAAADVVAADLDYNSRCDPRAARICAEAGAPITWVPIEVTLHTQLSQASLRRLQESRTPFAQALARLVAVWSERHFRHREHGQPDAACNLHDALAMAALLSHRSAWLSISDGVATAVDAAAFERFYLDRVLAAFG